MTVIKLRSARTVEDERWHRISLAISTLITTCAYLARDGALAGEAILALGDVARHAGSALALQRSVRRFGYRPAIDDGLLKLLPQMVEGVGRLDGRVHDDYVALMREACDELEAGARERAAAWAGEAGQGVGLAEQRGGRR